MVSVHLFVLHRPELSNKGAATGFFEKSSAHGFAARSADAETVS